MTFWGEGGIALWQRPACRALLGGAGGSLGRDAASGTRLGKPRPVVTEAAGRALAYPRSIRKRKQCVDMALRWELIALSLLAAIGLGLALGRGRPDFRRCFWRCERRRDPRLA
jgi:hypothetical protein